jgi:CHAD domain-containing protein
VIAHIYAIENAHFRDAARSLSPLRDAHTALVAYESLLDHYRGEVRRAPLAAVRRHLVQVEESTRHDTDDLEDRYAHVRAELESARRRIDDWPFTDLGLETWRAGFERTYRRARRAMSAAYDNPTSENFHEWRKAAKYHGYHVRLLQPLWDDQLRARREAADELSDLLGAYHDVVVLESRLTAGNGLRAKAVRRVQSLIDRRREEIEARARPVGMRLFAEKPRRIAARHSRYWRAWNEQQRCDACVDLGKSAA